MIRMMPSAAPPSSQLCVRYLAPADVDEDHGDLLAGLHERPIRIPSRYSYDDRGSELYEARIRQPEYYQLSLEKTLLAIAGHDLQSFSIDTICELGAGSALKASMLIKAMNASGRTLRYCPIDVNERVLRAAGAELAAQFPFLSTEALVGTYEQGLTSLAAAPGRKLFLFLGSTVGNLEDDEIVPLLQMMARHCSTEDRLLITADLRKDPQVALNAYCDAAGIGARMELNVLAHLNRLFDATFKLPNFAYRPIYNQMCDRVEARLVSLCSQRVQFPKLHTRLQLREGDVLRTDVMRKFPRSSLEKTFEGAGCTITRSWTDPRDWYAAFLLSFPSTPVAAA